MTAKDFLYVSKPGIVFGNAFAAVGGFFIGSPDGLRFSGLLGLFVGTSAIIAGSCAINNYLDRDLDKRMTRTHKRPLVTGALSIRAALLYAFGMLAAGVAALLIFTNLRTALIGLVGAILYTLVYGYAKRRTPYATLIGAFPGAIPPFAGYVAATGRIDTGAWLLFFAMFAWQIPHFYAIAIRRLDEYQAAHVPVMPAVKGLARTVWEMRAAGIAFPLLCYFLAHQGYAGFMFGTAMVLVSLYWLQPMFSPHWRAETVATATEVFKRSLLVLGVFCSAMVLSHILL